MTVYELLRSTMEPLVPACVPGDYNGESQEYCVFHVDVSPDAFADGLPSALACRVTMDWYLPRGVNPISKRREMCLALVHAGFTYPYVTDGSDSQTQRYIFECEFPEGLLDG